MRLPVLDLEDDIVARLRETRRLVLSAPTGSGKSTQVPQMLLRHRLLDDGQVVVLQPRRIAARLLAARVAEELGTPLGGDVGYQVRLENVTTPRTRIRFVTEGILLRQMVGDPSLAGVSTIVFDEFHERHLYGDVTLARALTLRDDLRLIVMSATLDVERLAEYLKPCAVVSSRGRTYPVDVRYEAGERPVWEQAADAFERHADAGDALIFMPGAFEIGRTLDALRGREAARGRMLLPLHGELPPRDQDAAVARHGRPKIVVATNVAETSLTIDGITLVIDSGLARMPRYDPNRGINTLLVEKISRASADQRSGRAGRTAPGVAVRLWNEREPRAAREVPEVKRLELSEVVLALRAGGVTNLRWLDPPDADALARAEELLTDLGALRDGAVTDVGRRMLDFPVHPRYARMLIAARELGCVREAALAAAITQGRDILLRRVDHQTKEFREDRLGEASASDFERLMRAWEFARKADFDFATCERAGIHAQAARQVAPVFEQFLRIAGPASSGSPEALAKCVLTAFSDRVARRLDAGTLRCDVVHGRRGTLARESAARGAEFLVAAEIREVDAKDGVNTILSLATAIDPAWLRELFPADIVRRPAVEYDAASKRVIAEERVCFRDLVLSSKRVEPPPAEEAARLLAREVVAGRITLKGWDAAVEQWIERVNFLARTCPELALPPIDETARRTLAEHVCHGATSAKDVRERPVMPVVREWLSHAQQALVEKHAPERLDLGGRRPAKVTYVADAPPYVAVKIQDLYDVKDLPRVGMGRVAPVVHILGPNMRPVQITQDLPGFWRDHYPRVRKELARKYPKHEWR